MNKYFLPFIGVSLIIGCKTPANTANSTPKNNKKTTTIDVSYMNNEARPQDDFFEYCNGTWVKNNPIPPSESRWGSFNELNQSNVEKLKKILDDAGVAKHDDGTQEQLLSSYYQSFMNMEERNKLGLEPIQHHLDKIDKINSKNQIIGTVAKHHEYGISSLFYFGVGQDLKDVENNIASIYQGGLGLPNNTYYIDEDKQDVKDAYEEYIRDMMRMLHKPEAEVKAFAKNVLDFETAMAKVMLTPTESRIPENVYHKMSRTEATSLFGGLDFEEYLSSTGISSFDSLNVSHPKIVIQFSRMIETTELKVWKDYLYWKVINHYAKHLTEDFETRHFMFYGTTMSGKSEMKPNYERAIDEFTGIDLGELLGKAFVETHYSDLAQERINELVDNLLIVFRERIENLDWMSKETKNEALNKLNSIGRKLGFPDKWTDFSDLRLSPYTYTANYDAVAIHSYHRNLEKLDKPVDQDEWGMPAHMVNAYYHPLLNEIAFPAGIMQPPFFDASFEDAVNYGGIGMVIGHEFTHGFDDMGSKFGADGSFTNWWTESDRSLFEERTAKLGNTFAGFCPIDGHCVNPQLTMGENIADLGGLTLAYHAYARTEEFKSGEKREGFTPAQRFFIAYAQLWKINFTDAELKKRIATDPHSPGMYRVNGPLMNCPEFFDAFNVQEDDPMRNSEEKVAKIW
jgi:putative endopeptidase